MIKSVSSDAHKLRANEILNLFKEAVSGSKDQKRTRGEIS